MPTRIQEAAKVSRTGPGTILLTIITPGQGSSGYYPPETIETAATERAFPRGTLGMINHSTEKEHAERPEGDLRNLIWVTLEDAYVNEDGALVAKTRVVSAWRDFVEEVGEFIGASISAAAVVNDGPDGRVVERILPHPFNTVDAVTVAGRGGEVSEILEAARVIESRSIVAEEVTASDIDGYIRHAILKAHANRETDSWAWLQSYDDEYAYFEARLNGSRRGTQTYRQKYTRDGVNVTLTGEPEEVLPNTSYEPVAVTAESISTPHIPTVTETVPSTSPIPAEESKKSTKEIKMAEIAEERLQLLEESHGRVPALEAKVNAAEARAEEAERRAAVAESTVRARDFAKKIITSANSELSESVVARIVDAATGTIPLTESLQLDTDALTETVNQAREAEETYLAQLAKENGLGQVRGIGETKSTEVAEASTDDIRNALKGA